MEKWEPLVKERQQELKKLLNHVKVFCDKNDIQYSLNGGTLLGAIRHKGFIPWDDDIDLMFSRVEWERFLKAVDNGGNNFKLSHYVWVPRIIFCEEGEFSFNKPWIDICIFDKSPANITLRKMKLLLIKMLQGMIKDVDYKNYTGINKLLTIITNLIGRPFSQKTKLNIYEKVSKLGKNSKSEIYHITNDMYRYLNLEYYEKDIEDYIDVEFEGMRCMSIKGYDNYLKTVYGNYMELPPIELRRPDHIINTL